MEAGLEPVMLKGPEVASRYPVPGAADGGHRLAAPTGGARPRPRRTEGAGWQVARPAGVDLYDTVLAHPDVSSLFLEMHYGLERTTERVTALDPLVLWQRRQPRVRRHTGLQAARDRGARGAAAHAGKPHHRFARLIWIADLAMTASDAAERGTPVDWDAVRGFAREARCVTVVGVALAMARRAGVVVPPDLFTLPTRGWRGKTIRGLLAETWPLTTRVLPGYRLDYTLSTTTAGRDA